MYPKPFGDVSSFEDYVELFGKLFEDLRNFHRGYSPLVREQTQRLKKSISALCPSPTDFARRLRARTRALRHEPFKLLDLPTEIIRLITNRLPLSSVIALASTCPRCTTGTQIKLLHNHCSWNAYKRLTPSVRVCPRRLRGLCDSIKKQLEEFDRMVVSGSERFDSKYSTGASMISAATPSNPLRFFGRSS